VLGICNESYVLRYDSLRLCLGWRGALLALLLTHTDLSLIAMIGIILLIASSRRTPS